MTTGPERRDTERRVVAHHVEALTPRCRAVLSGTLTRIEVVRRFGPRVDAVLDDGTGKVILRFLGRVVLPGFGVGARVRCEGTALFERGRMVLLNPRYEIASSETSAAGSSIPDPMEAAGPSSGGAEGAPAHESGPPSERGKPVISVRCWSCCTLRQVGRSPGGLFRSSDGARRFPSHATYDCPMPGSRRGYASRPLTVKCSFCGLSRHGHEVVHGPAADLNICRDCVALCVEIMGSRPGDDGSAGNLRGPG
jgi:hypothetical protein